MFGHRNTDSQLPHVHRTLTHGAVDQVHYQACQKNRAGSGIPIFFSTNESDPDALSFLQIVYTLALCNLRVLSDYDWNTDLSDLPASILHHCRVRQSFRPQSSVVQTTLRQNGSYYSATRCKWQRWPKSQFGPLEISTNDVNVSRSFH